jgi:cytochrome c
MEFLDNLVLPQSSEHIELLHYMLMLVLFLFVTFISIILGSTSLSLYFRKKGIDESNSIYLKFAKDIIEMLTINKSMGIILGIVPLLTTVLVFAQLLHTAGVRSVSYLIASFFITAVSIILIYTYRYSLSFTTIFDSIKELKSDDPDVKDEITKFKKGNSSLGNKTGWYGLTFLVIALWIFIASITLATYPEKWGNKNLIYLMFSWEVLSRFLHFVTAAFTITGGAVLFGFFYWEGGKKNLDETYSLFVRKTSIRITFTTALFQPFFLLINLFLLPGEALSASVFGYSFIALFLLFIAYHYLYAMVKESNIKYSGKVFYYLLFALLSVIVINQLAMGNATKAHSAILSNEFNKYLAELKGASSNVEQLSGKDIYQVRCASCHQFDRKLVGPPHDEVLPKYEGKKEQLIAFIRNPVKVNPEYPPMPNPGLKPKEAEVVATYLLETFEEHKKSK